MSQHAAKKRKLQHPHMDQPKVINQSALADNGNVTKVEDRLVHPSTNRKAISMRASTEIDAIYNSSIFQVQMNELISEVQPNYEKLRVEIDSILHKLKKIIDGIPARAPLSTSEAKTYMQTEHNISIPFPEPRPRNDTKYTLGYERPANINVIGSYVRKSIVQTEIPMTVDIAITMPSSLFQEKDYLNHRYFHKRAYYLANIAAGIQEAKSCSFIISFDHQNECLLQPVLKIASLKDGGDDDFSSSNCEIRILLATDKDLFPINKTLPWKNCLRAKLQDEASPTTLQSSTVLYNSTLRSECSVGSYLKLLHGAAVRSETFRDACILGTVWLRQRGFGTGIRQGGFGAFEFALTVSLLMQGGGAKGRPLLSTACGSYQIFKALLHFLATKDLVTEPLILFENSPNISEASKLGIPMLFDCTRGINILFKMMPWSYNALRLEAQSTLKALGESTIDRFIPSFISKIDDYLLQFDVLLRLTVPKSWELPSERGRSTDRIIGFCKKLYEALITGLGDRVTLTSLKPATVKPWSITSPESSADKDPVVIIGMLVNPAHISRTVDHGPPAEDKMAAASFRKFWGEKAELRRFKDGSIHESLIWTEKSASKNVLQQIVCHVIARHMGRDAEESIDFIATEFHQVLPTVHTPASLSLAQFQPLQNAYNALEQQIRNLEGLPLQIRKISASCADLRYASISPSVPNNIAGFGEAIDLVIQFEGSTRWPDNISAIQRTKIAFLFKLGELLEDSVTGLTTRLGLENEGQNLLNLALLDIAYPGGVAFRLRIHHDRESTLLERQLKEKSADSRSRELAASALSAYKQIFIQSPLHTQALRTLCTRFPLLSPSIRLMKQWCNSHLLSKHISPEFIELLTIRTFVHSYPWQVPGSLRIGFLRTLAFIAKWDWRSEPLVVDINGEMTREDVDAITVRLEAWRKIDPAMNRTVMFAASNLDPGGITWTERGPSKVVATRFTSLAKAACKTTKEQGLDIDVRSLFTHSLTDYDFAIHLNPVKCYGERVHGKKQSSFKNLQGPSVEDPSLIGHDPVGLYVDELHRVHGESVVFFYNASEMTVVAGLWSPQTSSRAWKVNLAYSSMPELDGTGGEEGEGSGSRVAINKAAILNDIARLGGDMVTRVEMNR